MPAYNTSGRYSLPALDGLSNIVSDIDDWSHAFRDLVDSIIATGYSGPRNNRPTSTSGTPGKLGRFYYATDEKLLYFDLGSAWIALASSTVGVTTQMPAQLPAGSFFYDTLTGQLLIGGEFVSGSQALRTVVNPKPTVTMLPATDDTPTLGSSWQTVPGITATLFLLPGRVVNLDASVMIEHATNNTAVAFWTVAVGTGSRSQITPTGMASAAGTVAGVNGSARLQAFAGATYTVPSPGGNYTFELVGTNGAGGGVVRGAGGVSWGRITAH